MTINTFNRQFARRLWRKSFISGLFWRNARQHGRDLSFRTFISNPPAEAPDAVLEDSTPAAAVNETLAETPAQEPVAS